MAKTDCTFTQEEIKELLTYNPETGLFKWKRSWKGRKKDLIAGSYATDKSGKTYHRICINGVNRKSHRLAWLYVFGEYPKNEIDHINGDGSDNRISNLRDVKRSINGKNRKLHNTNTSGACGVGRNGNKWRAQIKINGITRHIGTYEDFEEAVAARKDYEVKHGFHKNHGETRNL